MRMVMRNKWLFGISLAVVLFAACKMPDKQAHLDPIEYNNRIVDCQIAVVENFDAFVDLVDLGDSLGAAKALESALDTANAYSKKLAEMPDFEGYSSLRDNAKALIDLYAEGLDKDYRKIFPVLVSKHATLEQLENADQVKEAFADREDNIYAKLELSQIEFSKKFNFRLDQE